MRIPTEGSFGIEGKSKGESEVIKLLQEPYGSLYIVIRAEGEERRLIANRSGATMLHCGARLEVSILLLRKVSNCIAVSAFCRIAQGRVVVLEICHAALQLGVWLCLCNG
jgi:hypothetical protein